MDGMDAFFSHTHLSSKQNTRTHSMSTSMFDAMTVVYYMKYASGHGRSPFWRPITAIRLGSPAGGGGSDAYSMKYASGHGRSPFWGPITAGRLGSPAGEEEGGATEDAPPPPVPTPVQAADGAATTHGDEHHGGGAGHWPHWGLRDKVAFLNDLTGKHKAGSAAAPHHDDHAAGGGGGETTPPTATPTETAHAHGRRLLAEDSQHSKSGGHGGGGSGAPHFDLPPGGDGAVAPDPAWYPLMPTPPHPEYPAGHPTMAAAAAYVLDRWFGGDTHDFVVYSDSAGGGGGGGGGHAAIRPATMSAAPSSPKSGAAGVPLFPVGPSNRTFANAATAAGDAAASRVFAGAHYPDTVLDTLGIARAVAAYAWDGFTANIAGDAPAPTPTPTPGPTVAPGPTAVPGSAAAVRIAVGEAKAGLAAATEEIAGFLDTHKLKKKGGGEHGDGGGGGGGGGGEHEH
jgi:hypothetical protein